MEQEFHFSGKQLIENGWDGDFNTLDDFKAELKTALELGWNPKEMNLKQFYVKLATMISSNMTNEALDPKQKNMQNPPKENKEIKAHHLNNKEVVFISISDNEDKENESLSYEERRERAEQAGWDEEEMSLEEFEDYFG